MSAQTGRGRQRDGFQTVDGEFIDRLVQRFTAGIRKSSSDLVELDSLVSDEDDLVPAGPTETQNDGVLHLQIKDY